MSKFSQFCHCREMGLRDNMTWDELLNEIVRPQKYCTAGKFICPTLDRELRRADKERSQKDQYFKQLKRKGYTQAQIEQRKQKKRVTNKKYTRVELDFNEVGNPIGRRRAVAE